MVANNLTKEQALGIIDGICLSVSDKSLPVEVQGKPDLEGSVNWFKKLAPSLNSINNDVLRDIVAKKFKIENYNSEDEITRARIKLAECYDKIIYAHQHYLDWDIREIKLQAIWDISTYFFKKFPTFPYRFITAMKSSGKSRLLKMTECLVYKGKITTGMTDSALFRSADDSTLLFDEAEHIAHKDKKTQRLILNAGYKKGASIQVSREKYVDDEGKKVKSFVIESYPVYCPKMLANIWGMEEVLGDRCISSIMEKSMDSSKVKLIEDFEDNPFFQDIKRTLEEVSVVWCSYMHEKNALDRWNSYITDKYTTTPLYTNYTKLHQTALSQEELDLFNKIDAADLNGRYLELFFPLFIVANSIGEEILTDILEIAAWKVKDKKEAEIYESKDISVYDFVARQDSDKSLTFTKLSDLIIQFRQFFENDEETTEWLNTKWLGKALSRLNLITKKRRMGNGIEVVLNIAKAKEKIKIFRVEEVEDE